jgi:hydroxyacylglutathione hydrolase
VSMEIVTIPCLSDNYAYLLRDASTGRVGLVDAPEPEPVDDALSARGWSLDTIFVTHHHDDHIAGVNALRARHGAEVVGNAADNRRLPRLDRAVSPGEEVALGDSRAEVIDVPGHTIGHVAFHFPDARALFSADSLMVMGCGRLFEGGAETMWESLARLAALPPDTLVYSGHEYAESNVRFALSVDGDNRALRDRAEEIRGLRATGRPTVPGRLSAEIATNPFLRARDPEMKARLGMADAPDAAVFAEIRRRKDSF